MKPRFLSAIPVSLMALWLSTAQATLKPGDTVPALKPGGWIQWEPVSGFDAEKVYLVEFWADLAGNPLRTSTSFI